MAQAEARWWDDVQHLRKDAAPHGVPTLIAVDREAPHADAREDDLVAAPRPRGVDDEPARRFRRTQPPAPGRRFDRPAAEPRLGRSDAAGFAAAFDLDGAFGAPKARPSDRDAQVIVLRRDADQADAPDREVVLPGRRPADEPVRRTLTLVGPDEQPVGRFEPPAGPGLPATAIVADEPWEVERPLPARRSGVSLWERLAARPDRLAMWAVLLGAFLILLAVSSGTGS